MTSLIIFQITSILCFLFALKFKMYLKNLVGFVTISTVFSSVILAYLLKEFENIHYLLISLLLVFILVYNTYKSYKRKISCSE